MVQDRRTLLAKLGPRSARAALAGLVEAAVESDSMRTRLCGLVAVLAAPASEGLTGAVESAAISSALRFLLGLDGFDAVADETAEAAELPTRLQKSA